MSASSSGHAHALAVDRIEAADRVTRHEQAGWQALPFVEVTDAGWEAEGDRVIEWLRVTDHVVDVGEAERKGEVDESVGVGGRVVAEDAGERQHPSIALEPLKGPGPGMLGRCSGQHCKIAVEGVGGQSVGPGGVAQPDLHLNAPRRGVAERVEPCRGSRSAAAGVDHQVGAEHLLGAAVGTTQHARPVTRRPSGVVANPTTSQRSTSRRLGRACTRARTRCSRSGRLAHSSTRPEGACRSR